MYMSKSNQIKARKKNPYNVLFDIRFDSWSFNGYEAGKLKAQELCEQVGKVNYLNL
jgi:hypothetical protein